MLDVAATPTPPPATALAQGAALAAAELSEVERVMADLLGSNLALLTAIGDHVVSAGGKRLRPLLALLAARATGFAGAARLTVAAVGELIHTATLLHDDVVDGADFRRGRPAARHSFGNGLAVLAGDFFLARGLQAIAQVGELAAIHSLAATVSAMAEGEIAQLADAGDPTLDRARYYRIIEGKTASLLGWCAAVGGLVHPSAQAPLTAYGRELGFAFQISDDILDYAADPRITGKPRGQDLRDGKVTLPLILACEADPRLAAGIAALLAGAPPSLTRRSSGRSTPSPCRAPSKRPPRSPTPTHAPRSTTSGPSTRPPPATR